LEKPDGSASFNNRSLAPRKIFGLTKSEWELSSKEVPIRVSGRYGIFLALNFTTFVTSKKPRREKGQYRTGF
jgi:hypothetical protein